MNNVSIYDLKLSPRALSTLEKLKVKTLLEVSALTEEDLLNSKNCGQKTLREIKSILGNFGLSFRMKKEFLNSFFPELKLEHIELNNSSSFFDNFLLDSSGATTRVRNLIDSHEIKSVGDLRKVLQQQHSQQGIGQKSKIDLDRLVLQNTGFHSFNEISIGKFHLYTSPSFVIFLKKKFNNFSLQSHPEIGIYLSENFDDIPSVFQKYAEEFISCSPTEFKVIEPPLTSVTKEWCNLNLNSEFKKIFTEEAFTTYNVITTLNDIIISQKFISNQIYSLAKEIDLIAESGIDEYLKGKIPNHIASQLLHNEAETVNKAYKAVCVDNLRFDIFSKRLFASSGNESTLQEIANNYSLTRERVRQIEKKLLLRLKNYLQPKLQKQKEVLLKKIEAKPLGFALDELKDNEYFNDFFNEQNLEAATYISIIGKIYDFNFIIDEDLVLTEEYFLNINTTKKKIIHFFKKSTSSFISLDELYYSFFIDYNLLKYICVKELSCNMVADEVVNHYANSLSQRKKILDTISVFDSSFTAKDVLREMTNQNIAEGLTESRIISYVSTFEEVWILDWGKYIKKCNINLTSKQKDQIINLSISLMKKKKAIYSLHTLTDYIVSNGLKHEQLTPFIIGQILYNDDRFTKIGKIRIALKSDFPDTSKRSIEENLDSIFIDKQSPMPINDLREILVNDFGYAVTTVNMFLIKTPILIRLDKKIVSTKEFCGLSLSDINSIHSEIYGKILENSFKVIGLSNYVKKIANSYKISKIMAESILKNSSQFFLHFDLDIISLNSNPIENFNKLANDEILQILNSQHIYPDEDALHNAISVD